MSGTNGTGQFQVANGQIIDPNGNVFTAKGINLYDSQMGDATQVLTDFPGLNFIRLNVYSFQAPSAYAAFIQTMTAAGVVVELEDHTNSDGSNAGGASGTAFTGSQLTNESNWYASVASAYASNPYVWFGTNNEPPPGGLDVWEQATYNAIRGTGNNSPVMVELPGGGYPGSTLASYGYDPSIYTAMSNIVLDSHFYGWDPNYSTDQQTVDASLTSLVQGAQSLRSANGLVPDIIGEYGPSTNGSTTDGNASQVLQAVQQSTVTAGSVAWGWSAGANDNLTDGQGNLTSYGQEVAQSFGSARAPLPAPSTPAPTAISTPTPISTPAPTAVATPSVNDTVVTDTTSAITDASGNTWTITSGGQVAVNGTADTTTAGVIELAYVDGTIWQENSNNLWWSKTSPTDSWIGGAGTSPLPAVAPPVTAPPVVASPVVMPSVTPASSPTDTVVQAGSTAAIVDAAGNAWTITSGAQVAVNGSVDTTTANVIELANVNGTIWQENSSNLWWSKTSPTDSWIGGGAASPLPATDPMLSASPLPAAGPMLAADPLPATGSMPVATTTSPNDMVVMAGSTATIIDASGNAWSIDSANRVAVNGVADMTTANVTGLAYVNNEIWQENASNLWWGKTSPTDAWSPNAGTSTSPLPSTITIAQDQPSVTISPDHVSIVAMAADHMVFITGTGDTVMLSGGSNTVTDTGNGNTYVMPAAGNGYDTFTNNILMIGDTLDLRTALAATTWDGAAATLSKYLSVADTTQGAVLSIAPTSGGVGAAIATINGATNVDLTGLLAHALT